MVVLFLAMVGCATVESDVDTAVAADQKDLAVGDGDLEEGEAGSVVEGEVMAGVTTSCSARAQRADVSCTGRSNLCQAVCSSGMTTVSCQCNIFCN